MPSSLHTLLCGLSVFVLSQGACALCTDNADCNERYYCDGSSNCAPIPYVFVVPASGAAASSNTAEAFSFVIVSDIQYYFTNQKGEPTTECVFQPGMSVTDRKKALRQAARREVNCITNVVNTLQTDVAGIFDMGDLTNIGATNELAQLESFYSDLSVLSLPHAHSLGNHDYHIANDEGGSRMITYLEDSLKALHPMMTIRHIDFETTTATFNARTSEFEKYTTGSLCFSIEYNGYLFIVMHWSTALGSGSFEREFDHLDIGTNTRHFVKITGPKDWLETELYEASQVQNDLDVILMPHSLTGLLKFIEFEPSFETSLQESTMIALISGHVHDAYGKHGDWTITGSGGTKVVPVYYGGSTSYEKFIVAKLAANKGGLSVDTYDSKDGNTCTTTLSTSGDETLCAGGSREVPEIACV